MERYKPYKLPREFKGYVIAELRCDICRKEFVTAIDLGNFLGEHDGSFIHYKEDGGCGGTYKIIGSKGRFIIVRVTDRRVDKVKAKSTVAYLVGKQTSNPSPLEDVGWI